LEPSLSKLQSEIARTGQRGYPLLIAGAVFMLSAAVLSAFLSMKVLGLIWIIGMCSIFPFGLMIAKVLGVELLKGGNPLGILGGMMGGVQGFYIPVYIVIYQVAPEWLPMIVGLLAGSHFLVYVWIYKSKGYLFLTLGITLSALILGSLFQSIAYTLVPAVISIVFTITVFLLLRENRRGTVA
jgi:hypothetical protein